MKRFILTFISIILVGYIITACGGVTSVFAPTFTPAAPTATSSPTSIPPTPTPIWFDERLPHFSTVDENLEIGYAYRSILQLPTAITWGPDGFLYIADWSGQHIVKVSEDGFMEDLGIWKELDAFQQDGPRGVAFDSQGRIYFNTHLGIYRANLNGSNIEQLYSVEESTIGNIAIDTSDALYFSDTSENGGVNRLESDGSATLIAKVPYAENLAFGSDSSLFVTRTKSCPGFQLRSPSGCHASVAVAKKRTSIVKVDINTGRVVDFHYPNYWEFGDSIYITLDLENNLWVRVRNTLYRLSPQGKDLPYSIFTDIVKNGYEYRFGPAGGITFDNQDRIWLASGNSSLWILDPLSEEETTSIGHSPTETIFTRTLIVPGFNTSDISVDSSEEIFTPNINNGDVWQIPPGGNFDAYSSFEYDQSTGGGPSILVDDQETAYLGFSYGSIIKINPNGSRSPFVQLFTRSMTFGTDGLIYAVGGDVGKFKEIVKIDEMENVKTLAIDVGGTPLGDKEVHIAIAQTNGFYVFREENSSLYFLDYEDNSHFIADFSAITGGGPVVMTSSPVTGDVFLATQETTTVFIIDPEGNSQIFATGFIGGISAMAVSHDGKVLFIAEAGAIDRIFLSNP